MQHSVQNLDVDLPVISEHPVHQDRCRRRKKFSEVHLRFHEVNSRDKDLPTLLNQSSGTAGVSRLPSLLYFAYRDLTLECSSQQQQNFSLSELPSPVLGPPIMQEIYSSTADCSRSWFLKSVSTAELHVFTVFKNQRLLERSAVQEPKHQRFAWVSHARLGQQQHICYKSPARFHDQFEKNTCPHIKHDWNIRHDLKIYFD